MSVHGPTYIYSGDGAWHVSVELTQKMLEKVIDARGIKQVGSFKDVDQNTKLIVVPGGQSHFMDIFKEVGKISQYVKNGGQFLGICAGGIVASNGMIGRPPIIDIPENQPITQMHREGKVFKKDSGRSDGYLKLYSSRSVAPHTFRNIDFSHPDNVCPVDVFTADENKTFKSFYYSGPAFLEPDPRSKVLLRYKVPVDLQEVEGQFDTAKRAVKYHLTGKKLQVIHPVAALSVPYGAGQAVLTGIHPEMDPILFAATAKKYSFQKDFPEELSQDDSGRQALVNQIFSELKLI